MTSENLSAAAAPPRRLSLRGRDRKPLSATGDVAATAIEYVLRRRSSKRQGLPAAPVPESLRRSHTTTKHLDRQPTARPLWPTLTAAVLVVATTGLVGAALLTRQSTVPSHERHAVRGTLTLRGRPLADSVVEFHRLDTQGSAVETAFTDGLGHFALGDATGTGILSGEYGVVVRGRRRVVRRGEVFFEHIPLPPQYAKPDASPLKAFVSGPTDRLCLTILP